MKILRNAYFYIKFKKQILFALNTNKVGFLFIDCKAKKVFFFFNFNLFRVLIQKSYRMDNKRTKSVSFYNICIAVKINKSIHIKNCPKYCNY